MWHSLMSNTLWKSIVSKYFFSTRNNFDIFFLTLFASLESFFFFNSFLTLFTFFRSFCCFSANSSKTLCLCLLTSRVSGYFAAFCCFYICSLLCSFFIFTVFFPACFTYLWPSSCLCPPHYL